MIDHALLTPTLSVDDLESGCQLATAYDVASICIMPYYVRRCAEIIAKTTVLPSTVIGFPHGGQATTTKVSEADGAIADGAMELDMVVNISAVLSGRWRYVKDEIATIVRVAHAADRKVKVIFENCYLQDEHKKQLCEICCEVGADWVKTIDRIWHQRGDDGRPGADDQTRHTSDGSQSRRRCARPGRAVES